MLWMRCQVLVYFHLNLSSNMFPPRRNTSDRGPDLQERCDLHSGLSISGPAEEGWGHTAGGDKHQRGVHVAGVQQPHARHHQQPVQHGEDCGWKLRWVSGFYCETWYIQLSLFRVAAEKFFVSGDNARLCQIIILQWLLRFSEWRWLLLVIHCLLPTKSLCHCLGKECKCLYLCCTTERLSAID